MPTFCSQLKLESSDGKYYKQSALDTEEIFRLIESALSKKEGDKMKKLTVLEQNISYFKIDEEDYISITDMLKSKDGAFFVSDWLRNRNTIEFLGIWEEIHNPDFNYGEFAIIKSQTGLNNYKISVKE